MNNKIYLCTKETVDVDNCDMSIFNIGAFTNEKSALKCIEKLAEAEEKHLPQVKFCTWEKTKTENCIFYADKYQESHPYFDLHIAYYVSEVELTDEDHMLCTQENNIYYEIENYFDSNDLNIDEHPEVVKSLTEDIMSDRYLWDDFDQSLTNIVYNNADFNNLINKEAK